MPKEKATFAQRAKQMKLARDLRDVLVQGVDEGRILAEHEQALCNAILNYIDTVYAIEDRYAAS